METFRSFWPRLLLSVGAGLFVAAWLPYRMSAQSPGGVPVIVSGDVPFASEFAISALLFSATRLRVTTDGRRAVDVSRVTGNYAVADGFSANVRTWRFADHQPTTFEVEFRISRLDYNPCEDHLFDPDPVVEWRLPGVVDIRVHGRDDCLRPLEFGPDLIVGVLRGHVTCECEKGAPLSNVQLELFDAESKAVKKTKTRPNGSFDMGRVPPGTYTLQALAAGFEGRAYRITFSDKTPPTSSELLLKKSPPPRVPPPQIAAAVIPQYPVAARSAGLEGDVHLLASKTGIVVLDGPAILAQAALENVASWRPANVDLDVTFHYTLTPGDCRGEETPQVSILLRSAESPR